MPKTALFRRSADAVTGIVTALPEPAHAAAKRPGLAWGTMRALLAQAAPPEEVVGDRFQWARQVVRPALLEILGPEGSGWRTETRAHPERPGASQTCIFLTDTVEDVEHARLPRKNSRKA